MAVGAVRDGRTGEPVSGATVTIGGASATTAGDGSFLLNDIKPGLQPVTARKEGYRTYVGNAIIGIGVTVLPDIYLLPEGTGDEGALSGTVVNPLSQEFGVVGATVRLYTSDGTLAGTAASGYMGTFRFDSVPAGGPYTIEAEKSLPTGGRLTGRVEGIYVKAGKATSNVTVVVVEESRAGKISGVVKSADGSPIEGATVTATVVTPTVPKEFARKFAVSVRSREEGTFEVYPVPPGTWEVSASAAGFLSASKSVTVPEGGEAVADFSLQPRPAGGSLPSVEGLWATAYTYPSGASRRRAIYKAALRALGLRGPPPKFVSAVSRGMPPGFVHEIVLGWSASGEVLSAQGFEILRGLDPGSLSPRARVPSPLARFFSDLDPDFNAGATYFYAVRAFGDGAVGPEATANATVLPAVRPDYPPDWFEASLSSVVFRARPIPLANVYFVQTLRADPSLGVEEEVWIGGPYSASDIERGVRYGGPLLAQGTILYWIIVAADDPEEPTRVSISEVRRLIVK